MTYRCILIVLVVAWSVVACGRVDPPVLEGTPTPTLLSQWAVAAEASSQFGFPDWSTGRVTGAPDIGVCADDARAWASARGDGLAWLQLRYAHPVYATQVRIYQTLGRGAISKVSVLGEDGYVDVVWEGMDVTAPCPGTLIIQFPKTAQRVDQVRIDLDESRTGFWNEIDAVALLGMQ